MVHIVSDSFVFFPGCLSLSQVQVVSKIQAAPSVTFVRVVFGSSQVCYVVSLCSRLLLVVSSCCWLFWFVVGSLRCFQYVQVFQVDFRLLKCVVVCCTFLTRP